MFTRQKLLFQFTKAMAFVMLLCFIFICQVQSKKPVKEEANDMAEITAQIEFYEKEFEKDIKERLFVELKKRFKEIEPGFDKMADLMGDNAILVTPQGERLKGKGSIARFWRKEKYQGVMDVDFTLKYHYVIMVADPIEQPDPQDTIDAIGHAIIDYHLINPIEGGTVTNKTGSLSLTERHPRRCEWDD